MQSIAHTTHRALEGVHAMKRIFYSNVLHSLLSNLTIQSKSGILAKPASWKDCFSTIYGRFRTKMMAKHLNEHGNTYEMFRSTFEDNCDNFQAFDSQLHEAGVKRKAWRDKIWYHFTRQKST